MNENDAAPTHPTLSPQEAVDCLEQIHSSATACLRQSLERFIAGGAPPNPVERAQFRYPELRVTWEGNGRGPATRRSWAKFQEPGTYATTVTHPGDFRGYLMEQLVPLVVDYGATISVGISKSEIPYPYVLESGDELARGELSAVDMARHFPVPRLSEVGDEIADGSYILRPGEHRPLSLFDAARTEFSLKRIVHYTGSDWRRVQPWILLTNYNNYMAKFAAWALAELARPGSPYQMLTLPGGGTVTRGNSATEGAASVAAIPSGRFQMPAFHLSRSDGSGGITIVNIGVGPSNAKNITDHLAVLRPHCWLMIGHCAGLRQSQAIGDYVLAHAYLRRDGILDAQLPPEIPIPPLAEVQVALQRAAESVTGQTGDEIKKRLRTGTVVTYADRNWEMSLSKERQRINLSRGIAVDMESGTVAAQGYRLRVPYGTFLCVSDKPMQGELKLPGAANAFYTRAVGEHFEIGLATFDILREQIQSLHSRKLRSFDEPVFR